MASASDRCYLGGALENNFLKKLIMPVNQSDYKQQGDYRQKDDSEKKDKFTKDEKVAYVSSVSTQQFLHCHHSSTQPRH